jgi:hypothetical protein
VRIILRFCQVMFEKCCAGHGLCSRYPLILYGTTDSIFRSEVMRVLANMLIILRLCTYLHLQHCNQHMRPLRSCLWCPENLDNRPNRQTNPCSKHTIVTGPNQYALSTVVPPQSGIFNPFFTMRFSSIRPHLLSHFCASVSNDFFHGSS